MDAKGLRILAFCDWFDQRNGGGAERVAMEVWERLAAAGAEIRVVAAEPGGRSGRQQRGRLEVVRQRGVDASAVLGGQALLAPGVFQVARAEASSFRPDVLHASSLHFLTSLAAASVAHRTGTPMVVTSHVAGIDRLPLVMRLGVAAYEATAGRRILRASSRVIAVSTAVARHLQTLGVPAGDIDVVPNGVDLARFRPGQGDYHEEQAAVAGDPPPLVLFVGRLVANKGPATFIDALGRLKASGTVFRAAIVGDGPLRAKLERRAQALGLTTRLEFAGHQSDVVPWFREAVVLARPSSTEGRSLAMLEAMAAGVCVVASDIAANVELLSGGDRGVLVPPGDPDTLAAALSSLLDDQDRRHRLSAAASEHASQFSWDHAAEMVGTSLTTAAGAGRRPPAHG